MAWKNFQNGYPLYASELNNYLMNQAVVVFASAAERDSVLTSPIEGQVVWLQDTNAFKIYNGTAWTDINDNTDAIQKSLLTTAGDTIYATGSATPARLALGSAGSLLKSNGTSPTWLAAATAGSIIKSTGSDIAYLTPGTNGQILTSSGTDIAWQTPAGGGGMTLLSTTSLSGNVTSITNISQAYKNLYIRVDGVTMSSAGVVETVLRNGSNGVGEMYLTGVRGGSSAAQVINHNTATFPHGYLYKTTGGANSFVLEVANYTNTDGRQHPVRLHGGAETSDGGYLEQNTAGITKGSAGIGGINRVDIGIQTNTGYTFTGGTAYIYGVN